MLRFQKIILKGYKIAVLADEVSVAKRCAQIQASTKKTKKRKFGKSKNWKIEKVEKRKLIKENNPRFNLNFCFFLWKSWSVCSHYNLRQVSGIQSFNIRSYMHNQHIPTYIYKWKPTKKERVLHKSPRRIFKKSWKILKNLTSSWKVIVDHWRFLLPHNCWRYCL